MSALDFDNLREANVLRCETAYHAVASWSATDWGCAMAGEMGEACNKIKKLRRLEDSRIPGKHLVPNTPSDEVTLVEEIGEEIADMIIYADLLTARLGIDLGEAVRRKFNKTSARVLSKINL